VKFIKIEKIEINMNKIINNQIAHFGTPDT
jgi:hypothetical protein